MSMVIDCHAHLWGEGFLPPAFFRSAAENWAAKEPARTPDMILPRLLSGIIDETGDLFVANMDRAGVDATIIQMVDGGAPLFGEEPPITVDAQLDRYASIQARHPGRLYVSVYPDHRRPNALNLIRRAVLDLGFISIGEITPDGFAVDDPALRPAMQLAADLGAPVQIHTRTGIWTEFEGRSLGEDSNVHPIHVARLAKALPDLRIVLNHIGYPFWWQVTAELIAGLPNCVLDISNWNECMHQPRDLIPKLAAWRSLVGIERILFGSDQVSGPRFCGERSTLKEWVAFIADLPRLGAEQGYRFTRHEVDLILGGNARRFYGLQGAAAEGPTRR